MTEKQKLRHYYHLSGYALEVAHSLLLRNYPMSESALIGLNAAAIKDGSASAWCPPASIPYKYAIK